jgi:prepilin-type N-terminal cleavage/methylation domain-containing protein/prepilin-type processing-associated H-X9-DG protein
MKKFTLIELLIVIAIIAILISMLMPALRKARDSASRIACAGNLKQIAQAAISYASDYKGFIPYNSSSSYNYLYNRNSIVTGTPFPDYLGVPAVYKSGGAKDHEPPPISRCPEGGRDGTKNLNKENGTPNFSYGFCTFLGNSTAENMFNIHNPSGRLLLGDLETGGGYSLYSRSCFGYRHNARTNIIYIDGHLETLKYLEVPYRYNSATDDPTDFYITH